MSVGYLVFLQEQIKGIIIIRVANNFVTNLLLFAHLSL
jgi:hypothetical protein